jgi:hypothetical protein
MTSGHKPSTADEGHTYKAAWERAEAIQGLHIHLLVFAVINAGLFGINWVTRGDGCGWWFYWPLLAWGIGLLTHILAVVAPLFSPDWVDRQAERIMTNRSWRPSVLRGCGPCV